MESGKNIPKDTQVVADILEESGIEEYEDRVLNHMLEFTNKYVSSVIDYAVVFSNHTNNKTFTPLPQIKSSAVSRLPPDRHSLTACNYRIKSRKKKARSVSRLSGLPTNSAKVSGPVATSSKPSPKTSATTKIKRMGWNSSKDIHGIIVSHCSAFLHKKKFSYQVITLIT
ncbi:transcription initiation factor TFIID subunit 9 [Trichonephila inaurata madagascariensis]|uniref:Transcription initiation factor TFIID subunit 9 n=1 Tax=Trichonephila inaurata madagascariensis TaxID=2747483 RepID=A0A8X6IUR0_9ARAC|nr:transcription initiation factor TFIID subunit 9 [Trichonephila inaurata madagascariensis]